MRETQSELVLAESGKDKDNYSLNRQSLRWHPHNHTSVGILGSFDETADQRPQKKPSNEGERATVPPR